MTILKPLTSEDEELSSKDDDRPPPIFGSTRLQFLAPHHAYNRSDASQPAAVRVRQDRGHGVSAVASAGGGAAAEATPAAVFFGGPDLRPVSCTTCESKELTWGCGCTNGQKMVACYICLNTTSTWCCGCKRDTVERAAAVAAGLRNDPVAIREARGQGELQIQPGNEYAR